MYLRSLSRGVLPLYYAGVLLAIGKEVLGKEASAAELATPNLTYRFTLNTTLGSKINIGLGSAGSRLGIPVMGGKVDGQRANGTIIPGGANFGAIDTLGVFNVDARLIMEMDDGSYVYVHPEGPLVTDTIAINRMKFETGSKKYSWLNEIFSLAITNDPGPWVSLEVWQVEPSS